MKSIRNIETSICEIYENKDKEYQNGLKENIKK